MKSDILLLGGHLYLKTADFVVIFIILVLLVLPIFYDQKR